MKFDSAYSICHKLYQSKIKRLIIVKNLRQSKSKKWNERFGTRKDPWNVFETYGFQNGVWNFTAF